MTPCAMVVVVLFVPPVIIIPKSHARVDRVGSGALHRTQLLPAHMPAEADWKAHVDARKRNKKDIVKRMILFLVRVLPAFFHCALKELEKKKLQHHDERSLWLSE